MSEHKCPGPPTCVACQCAASTPAPAWLEELSHLREAAEHGLVHDMGHLLNLLYDHAPELLSLARKHYSSPEEAQRGSR